MMRRATVTIFTCDRCGKERWETKGGDPANGIRGTFVDHSDTGGVSGDFFACSLECLAAAVQSAVESAVAR